MKILVPGGAGYIGSHTCQELARQGYEPVVYDNFVHGHPWAVQWGLFVEGDIHDTERLIQTIREHRIEGVIHFAAYTYVGESVADPLKYYRNNVAGTVSLLNALAATGVGRIVFSSTAAVYGNPEQNPIVENAQLNPINPYGASKRMVEIILQDAAATGSLKAIALRYFNACGASETGEIGEDHEPETHLIPLAIRAAHDPDFSLTLFGDDYSTRDGTCVRDYIHVTDLADAHIRALQYLEGMERGFEVFNLGTNTGYTNREIIGAVEQYLQVKVKLGTGPRRPGDPETLVASNEKARRVLGWKPTRDLEAIITSAGRWHRLHHFQR